MGAASYQLVQCILTLMVVPHDSEAHMSRFEDPFPPEIQGQFRSTCSEIQLIEAREYRFQWELIDGSLKNGTSYFAMRNSIVILRIPVKLFGTVWYIRRAIFTAWCTVGWWNWKRHFKMITNLAIKTLNLYLNNKTPVHQTSLHFWLSLSCFSEGFQCSSIIRVCLASTRLRPVPPIRLSFSGVTPSLIFWRLWP